MDPVTVSASEVRVNYSDTDQMGVVYHARYLVWLDIARTEHLRQAGMSYRELEMMGFRLVVTDLAIRYRQPARYDDLVRVRCWVRALASRRVTFGYAVEHTVSAQLLATATTAMIVLSGAMTPTRLPDAIRDVLIPVSDPVRI